MLYLTISIVNFLSYHFDVTAQFQNIATGLLEAKIVIPFNLFSMLSTAFLEKIGSSVYKRY